MAGKKILVADDSLTIQKVIRLALSNEGYEIQAISDGNEAIQHISVFRPDIVLIDVSLPGRSAVEVKEEANRLDDFQRIRFVLMSSAFEKIDELEATRVGFHGRLTKPFDPANLRQVLAEVAKTQEAPLPPFSPKAETTPKPPLLEPYLGVVEPTAHFEPPVDSGLRPPPAPSEELMEPIRPDISDPSILVSQSVSAAESIKTLWDDPPAPPSEPPSFEESDIKHLTDSTIRMSGLDDFQWNVKEPSLKPFPNLGDDGGVSFTVPPPPHYSQDTHLSREDTAPSIPAPPRPAPVTSAPPPHPTSETDRDDVIRRQVQETLEKMVQQLLPDLAEKVIKQEIHRLLSEKA